MSKVLIALTVMGWLNRQAFGGLAVFSPSAVEVTPGTPVVMDITLQAEGVVTTINGADVVIGSDDVDFSFAYSAAFMSAMPNLTPTGPALVYTVRDYLVGGSNLSAGAGTLLSLGRVTIDTTALPLERLTIRSSAL